MEQNYFNWHEKKNGNLKHVIGKGKKSLVFLKGYPNCGLTPLWQQFWRTLICFNLKFFIIQSFQKCNFTLQLFYEAPLAIEIMNTPCPLYVRLDALMRKIIMEYISPSCFLINWRQLQDLKHHSKTLASPTSKNKSYGLQ